MVDRKCANKQCGEIFSARVADVKRGWARFCSKSCKAHVQEQRTGQYADLIHRTPHALGNFEGDGEAEPLFADAHLFSNEEYNCSRGNDDPPNC
jgi:hypothetical protein